MSYGFFQGCSMRRDALVSVARVVVFVGWCVCWLFSPPVSFFVSPLLPGSSQNLSASSLP